MRPVWSSVSLDGATFQVRQTGSLYTISSAHRLHLFSLDLSAEGLERAGGAGLSVPSLPIDVAVCASSRPDFDELPDDLRDELTPLLDRLRTALGTSQRFDVTVTGRLYRHRGLGSTTQVRGLVAVAAAACAGVDLTPQDLAALEILDAGSCVGLTLMTHPGLVLDLGFIVRPGPAGNGFVPHHRVPGHVRRPQGLALRLTSPPPWTVVLAIPAKPALSGAEERAFWSRILPVPRAAADEAAYWTLMDLMPAMLAADLDRCHHALDALGRLSTKADEIEQQGAEARCVMALLRARFGFSGMSSLGPCSYTLTERALPSADLAELAEAMPEGTDVLQFALSEGVAAGVRP